MKWGIPELGENAIVLVQAAGLGLVRGRRISR